MMIKINNILLLSTLLMLPWMAPGIYHHQEEEEEVPVFLREHGNLRRQLEPLVSVPNPIVPDSYIIVFDDTAPPNMPEQARNKIAELGGTVKFEYNTVLKGVAATLPAPALEAMKNQPGVSYIEQDQVATATTLSWGLDRIDQGDLPLDGSYTEDATNDGSGVNVCIIDTGIDKELNSFFTDVELNIAGGQNFIESGRGKNKVTDPDDWDDCNGHGTHVAGTVASKTYGVAAGASVWGVRVLDCNGSGTYSGVIAGVDWCAEKAKQGALTGEKWVGNMSLGGGFSQTVNDAVRNATTDGVLMVVAAGNDDGDACSKSPASEPTAITVGATSSNDQRASFSNYGSCVDIFAPGVAIPSYTEKNGDVANYSGTSMASPHVAGAAALFYQTATTRLEAEEALLAKIVPNVVGDAGIGSPNKLVQVPATSYTPSTTCASDADCAPSDACTSNTCEFGQCFSTLLDCGGDSGGGGGDSGGGGGGGGGTCCGGGVSDACDEVCCGSRGTYSTRERGPNCWCATSCA
mmetsp:Transcript_10064/g.18348  ORF Transcript_10064/g.18348 Transcript_10064/m.18348 type:complete len:520 (+) Transcript_10064:94-1653(+)